MPPLRLTMTPIAITKVDWQSWEQEATFDVRRKLDASRRTTNQAASYWITLPKEIRDRHIFVTFSVEIEESIEDEIKNLTRGELSILARARHSVYAILTGNLEQLKATFVAYSESENQAVRVLGNEGYEALQRGGMIAESPAQLKKADGTYIIRH